MSGQNLCRDCLEAMAQVLIRCFLGGAVFLLIWFAAYATSGDWMYHTQTRWFTISREQFELINYCGIAAVKLFNIAAFLIPYLAVRLVLRKLQALQTQQ